ncbi:MAG: ABC transporter ATP-binding protein, partial [Sulfolobales archaeon]
STDLLDLLEIPRNRSSLGVKRISSGERRRIAFISAISRGKRLFLIDEPTVGLDPRSKYLLFRLMRELAERGYGFIISSHDPLVELISDEIVEIER